jgi:hypothetical protein
VSRERLSDTATEADWSFIEVPAVYAGLQKSCERAARNTGADAEELFQDMCLWLAVREHTRTYDLTTDRGIGGLLHWAGLEAERHGGNATRHDWRLQELPEYSFDD